MRKKILDKNIVFVLLGVVFVPFFWTTNVLAEGIVILGDSQRNEHIQKKMIQTILPYQPSIVFRAGDLVDDGHDAKQWKTFNDINEPLLTTAEYFPALGNHERGSALYFDNFPFLKNRRWYSVEREGIHFIVLDSNSDLWKGSKQYAWLEEDLRGIRNSVKYRIVIFHHPLFGIGNHKEDEKHLRAILLPLFQQYNVNATFSGHDHNYQRFEHKGIFFIVTGGGGASLYAGNKTSPYLVKFHKTYHFCLLSLEKDSLRVKVIDINSNVIDEFQILATIP